ncbi:MAG: SIMPL domain-containing protein [Pseudomonadota bacterium]
MRKIDLLGMSLVLVLSLFFSTATNAADRTITVTGKGTRTAAPDIAVVTLGVVSEARTAREALSRNTGSMQALKQTLTGQGVAEEDLQTSNFSVQPRYVYPKRQANGAQQPPRIVGYTVSNQLTGVMRDLDKLGEILDAAVSTGSNQIHSLRFSIDKPQPLRDEARKIAVARAVAKAKLLTEAAGVRLGQIMAIREAGGSRPPVPVARARAFASEAAAAPVPVARGEQEVSAQVTITWQLN